MTPVGNWRQRVGCIANLEICYQCDVVRDYAEHSFYFSGVINALPWHPRNIRGRVGNIGTMPNIGTTVAGGYVEPGDMG
jgi:hypothetical protein